MSSPWGSLGRWRRKFPNARFAEAFRKRLEDADGFARTPDRLLMKNGKSSVPRINFFFEGGNRSWSPKLVTGIVAENRESRGDVGFIRLGQ
jgi:hypothetical protein